MDKIQVKGQYTWIDSKNARSLFNQPTNWWRRIFWISNILFIFSAIGSFFDPTEQNTRLFYTGLIIWFVYMVNQIIVRTKVDRGVKEWKEDESINREIEITLDSQSISWESRFGKIEYPWSLFSRFQEARDYIFLIISYSNYSTIPKRLFSAEDLVFLKEQLANNDISETPGRSMLAESLILLIASGLIILVKQFS